MLDAGRLVMLREVARRGTIASAARSLGLTPSAVSQQLAVLEREAGCALLDRSPRGVALTGAGRALADRAAAIVDVLAAARADLDRLGGSVSGPVTVAAVAGDADIAVVDEYDYVPLALPDHLDARELHAEPLVAVGAPGALPRRVALASLADADWVMPPDSAACGQAVRSACRAAGFEPRVRWETDDMLLLVRAVAAGHGVSVLPRLAVAGEVADVDIRPLRAPALRRRISAVTRSSASARPVVRAVLNAFDAARDD